MSSNTKEVKKVPASCTDLGTNDAYMMIDGECKYAFNEGALFTGIAGDKPNSEGDADYVGFKLEMQSSKACKDDDKFKVTINAYCDEKEDAGKLKVLKQTECSLEAEFKGKEACKLYTFELGKHLNKVKPFLGALLIIGGLAMTFAGAKLLFQIFGGLVFLLTTSGLFMIIYNFFLPVTSSGYIVSAVAVFASAIGILLAIFTYKFAKEWAVTLLAAWGGIILSMVIVSLAGITNATLSILLAVICAIAAGYFGKKMDKIVRTAGTSFVGAGLVIKGVSFYLATTPEASAQNDPIVWGLLGGLIFLTVTGTLF